LKQTASIIKQSTRGCDFIARYGGDEFFAVLTETDEPGAVVVAERMRIGFEQHIFLDENQCEMSQMSITIGISCLPSQASNKRDMIRTADFALYQGKSAGKNRVVLFEQESIRP
jgi:diguanylate cyclase (GGDEF)-like protein